MQRPHIFANTNLLCRAEYTTRNLHIATYIPLSIQHNANRLNEGMFYIMQTLFER